VTVQVLGKVLLVTAEVLSGEARAQVWRQVTSTAPAYAGYEKKTTRRKIVTYIKTIPENEAESLVQEIYQAAQKNMGYVPNYAKALSIHPEVYDAWTKLIGAIRSNMRLRRYELVTFACAMALECTY
jgi:hypothetical protein